MLVGEGVCVGVGVLLEVGVGVSVEVKVWDGMGVFVGVGELVSVEEGRASTGVCMSVCISEAFRARLYIRTSSILPGKNCRECIVLPPMIKSPLLGSIVPGRFIVLTKTPF